MSISSLTNTILANGMNRAAEAILPTRTTVITMGTLGVVGGALGGLPGLALGVGVGFAISPLTNATVGVISVGVGKVVAGITYCAQSAVRAVKHTIYCALETVFGWLARWSDSSEWAIATYNKADEAYLQKTDPTGQSLRTLFQPKPGGVAAQENIINALSAQAAYLEQPVTEQNIRDWVALGEHLVHALADPDSSLQADGKEIVVTSASGTKVNVESSIYSVRAISWYVTAQAVWHASLREDMTSPGVDDKAASKEGSVNKVAAQIMKSSSTFVLPDAQGQLFSFISGAPTSYVDNGHVLNKQSLTDPKNAMQLPALDDVSRHLPAGAKRLMVNTLASVEEGGRPRIAIQLQALPNPTSRGQRGEGHEPAEWQTIQRTTGFATKVMAAIDSWNGTPVIAVQSVQQSRYHVIHQEISRLLEKTRLDEDTQKKVYANLSQLPLISLLALFQPAAEHDPAKKDLYNYLLEIDIPDYDALKRKIADEIVKEASGTWEEELLREGDEINVPTDLKTVNDFKQHITTTQQEISTHLAPYRERRISLSEQVGVAVIEGGVAAAKIIATGTATLAISTWNWLRGKTDEVAADPFDPNSREEDEE